MILCSSTPSVSINKSLISKTNWVLGVFVIILILLMIIDYALFRIHKDEPSSVPMYISEQIISFETVYTCLYTLKYCLARKRNRNKFIDLHCDLAGNYRK